MVTGVRTDVGIRPYGGDDLPLLERLLGDPAMMRHLGGPESPDALRARHDRYLATPETDGGLFTVTVAADDAPSRSGGIPAGWVGYWETEWQGECVWECGWHVLPEFQGEGVAFSAMRLLLADARGRGRHRFVHAFPSVGNGASNALCRRLGFELLGEVEVEYPKGHLMHSNDWRLDLVADQ